MKSAATRWTRCQPIHCHSYSLLIPALCPGDREGRLSVSRTRQSTYSFNTFRLISLTGCFSLLSRYEPGAKRVAACQGGTTGRLSPEAALSGASVPCPACAQDSSMRSDAAAGGDSEAFTLKDTIAEPVLNIMQKARRYVTAGLLNAGYPLSKQSHQHPGRGRAKMPG